MLHLPLPFIEKREKGRAVIGKQQQRGWLKACEVRTREVSRHDNPQTHDEHVAAFPTSCFSPASFSLFQVANSYKFSQTRLD